MTDKAKTVASALRMIVGGDFATVGGEKVIRIAAEFLDEQAVEIERLKQNFKTLQDGVNRRCGLDLNQLPLVSVDRLVKQRDECRRLLRQAWTASCQNTILPRAWAEQTLEQITAAKAGGEA